VRLSIASGSKNNFRFYDVINRKIQFLKLAYMILHFNEINWLSVIVVTVLSFPLGALWHTQKLFGKAWMEDNQLTKEKARSANPAKIFGGTALLHFIAVTGLDGIIGASSDALSGLHAGLFVSVFFVLTAIGGTYLFASRSFRILLIDAGYYILFFGLSGLILGAW